MHVNLISWESVHFLDRILHNFKNCFIRMVWSFTKIKGSSIKLRRKMKVNCKDFPYWQWFCNAKTKIELIFLEISFRPYPYGEYHYVHSVCVLFLSFNVHTFISANRTLYCLFNDIVVHESLFVSIFRYSIDYYLFPLKKFIMPCVE